MKLFHAFPRPAHQIDASGRAVRSSSTDDDRRKGLAILKLILTNGLLCTPEKFKLYPNHHTENAEKRRFADAKTHHDTIVQSRACFTSMDLHDLSKEYEMSGRQDRHAHVDLFGEFAIGLDPIEARAIGIMPTVYYYRHDIKDLFSMTAGLGSQIIERLDEMRCLFSVLSYIEAKANPRPEDADIFLSPERLKRMGIEIRCQKDIEAEITNLNPSAAAYIFNLINTDRVPAWNLVDFVGIMLSLYQTTDSTIEKDAPLAFFQQREWRLVHHMMKGLMWFSMGKHPADRDPDSEFFKNAKRDVENFLRSGFESKGEDYITWFLNQSWVLAGTEKIHFRNFVREIVVPESCAVEAQSIVDSLPFRGTPPIITPLPPRWRIATENGMPRIVLEPNL